MLFNNLDFLLLFLPVTIGAVYFSLKISRQLGVLVLMLMSLGFYAWWFVPHLTLLVGSIVFNYFMARLIENKRNKGYLYVGILSIWAPGIVRMTTDRLKQGDV